jgi:hypothetical protein
MMGNETNPGIIPRAVDHVFAYIGEVISGNVCGLSMILIFLLYRRVNNGNSYCVFRTWKSIMNKSGIYFSQRIVI